MSDQGYNCDYSKGVIYWIGSDLDPRIYIGSTVDPDRRFLQHRTRFLDLTCKFKFYEEARKVGWESYWMMIVEEWPCSCEKELVRREFVWIEATPEKLLLNTDIEFGKRTEETKRKMRDAWTEERRAAQGELTRMAWTEERRATQVERQTGQNLSQATKQKISEAWTEERRAAHSLSQVGSKHPQWKGGSVIDHPKTNRWIVQWRAPERKRAYFGYGPKSKYPTNEEAEKAARAFHAALIFDY